MSESPMVPVPTDEEKAANYRSLRKMHVANRFLLMFGHPLLPEPGVPCGNQPQDKEEAHE